MDNDIFKYYEKRIIKSKKIGLIVLAVQALLSYHAFTEYARSVALIQGRIHLFDCFLTILFLILLQFSESQIFSESKEEIEKGLKLYNGISIFLILDIIISIIAPIIGVIANLYINGF